ncbi:Tyrosyl-DNA phosphodiesterase [Drechslerella dactyloides]|uniref:Tyrosyl-DNA phosphodiesterase n=1 Tax=Drechslerella dactyloides TaxID=74499 RepID=A0AAD6J753_DREDA|nr:Tyrosyl-DNA phosphodiesterase [Drechslerella dactyloides]
MADDSYDDDLAEAIRRSLADQGGSSEPSRSRPKSTAPTSTTHVKIKKEEEPSIIVLDSDDDAEDDKEMAIKREEQADTPSVKKEEQDEQKPKLSTMLNLDRAQMEKDRLARRKRKTSDDSHVPQAKHVKTLATQTLTFKKEESADPPSESSTSRRGPFMTLRDLQERVASYVPRHTQYFDGVVKKTYVQGRDRTPDDIKLEEVFQKDTLQTAVLSAYVWEFIWVLQKLNVGECDLVLVLHAKEDEMVDHYRRNLCNLPRTRLCFPNMSGNVNCMHSKLQLLFHLTYLRVVVPTANMTPYDWGEALGTGRSEGVMENSVFIIDFPELPKTSATEESNPSHTHFSKQLLHFCKAKGLPADIIEKLEKVYDFSRSKHLGFVYSIGGSHHGTEALNNGVCGLATAVRGLGLKTRKPMEVDYVTSSVGSLNKEFLLRMFRALHGDDGKKSVQGIPKKYSSRQLVEPAADESTESESEEEDESDNKLWRDIRSSVRVYFPSRRTVAASKGGIENGGTICFQRKWFMSSTFPQSLLHDCQSVRSGLLMHNKMIFVRLSRPRGNVLAWAYIGSANLSESAWGKLVWDRTQKEFKMSNRNWECGVIVPVSQPGGQKQEHDAGSEASTPDMDIFAEVIPVPMSTPAPLLTAENPPWYFGELRGNP